MRPSSLLFYLLIVTKVYSDLLFLKAIFNQKNVLITANVCWNFDKIKLFMKEMNDGQKIRTVFTNKHDILFNLNLATNTNYLLLDVRNCSKARLFLKQVDILDFFNKPIRYLILMDKLDEDLFSNLTLTANSAIVVAFENNNIYTLLQPYQVQKGREIIWENYGNWSMDNGWMENFKTIPISQRRYNLKRAHFNVSVVIGETNDTWNHLTDFVNPEFDTFTKQDFESTTSAFQQMNISYTLIGTDSYGYYDPKTKLYTGLMGQIQQGVTHIGASSMFFNLRRFNIVDGIKMGNPLSARFLVKKPSTSYLKNIFWITLSNKVWLSSAIVLLIFSVANYILLNWEAKSKQGILQDRYSASDVTLVALEAVCQQGTCMEPRSFSGRITSFILFTGFMFIYVSYSANIVVLLQSTTPINNLRELLDSRIDVAGDTTKWMINYFKAPRSGVLKDLYQKKIKDNYYEIETGMERLRRGGFAYHVRIILAYQYILKKYTNYDVCGLQELPGYIESDKGYVAIAKNSSYKDFFKVGVLKIDEYGIQRRVSSRVIMKPRCHSNTASFMSVGIYDCYKVFVVWIFGVTLSLCTLLLEVLVHRVK